MFIMPRPLYCDMDSVQAGLRADDLERDTYDRLQCTACGSVLKTQDDSEGIGRKRVCPDCRSEWREL